MKLLGIRLRTATVVGGITVTVGGILVGCGGGGGGGSSIPHATTAGVTDGTTAGATLTSGSSAGSSSGATAGTTSGATAGTTSGSTAGSTSGTTSGSTSGTTSGSTAGSTAGSTSGSTSGTTSGSTAGTTAGSTSGTTSGTTAGSTAGTTAGSTSGGGGETPGFLRANAIYFMAQGTDASIRSVLASGSGLQSMATLPANVSCAITDPTQSGKFIYASNAASSGSFSIYRSSSLTGGTLLLSRTFDDVSMIQATSDGSVFVLAVSSGVRGLYVVRSGTATLVDLAESAAIRSDGSQAVYVKLAGDATAVAVWTASTGVKRTLVSGGFNHMPAISRDGTQVVYSALDLDRGDFDLYTIPTAGGTIRRLTNTAGRSEYGASFDETGTRISYAATATSDAPGIYVYSGGVSTRIVDDSTVTSGTYWASSTGRSIASAGMTRISLLTPLPR